MYTKSHVAVLFVYVYTITLYVILLSVYVCIPIGRNTCESLNVIRVMETVEQIINSSPLSLRSFAGTSRMCTEL